MASALRRYAYAQARIRARLAGLLTHPQLELLASYPDEVSLRAELAAAGRSVDGDDLFRSYESVLAMLEGPPRELVARLRDRYAAENLKLLLRARERGLAWPAVERLLLPEPLLGAGRRAQEMLEAPSLRDALERLPAGTLGEALRRHAEAAAPHRPERFRLELVADREVYERLWDALLALAPADRLAAERLLGTKLDCVNLSRAARMRVEHGLAPEEMLIFTVRGGRFLGAPERAALAHEPVERWSAALAHTPYARALADAPVPPRLERGLARLVAREARRALRGSPFHVGVPLAFLLLAETELDDLRLVFEGRRFGWSEARILEQLATERRH
jgi:vacuolar-type H+-ATPase subunit C/Vma6